MADGTDAATVRMSGLKERFAQLPDPRSTVNRQHLLVDVVAISVCGVLAGADGPTAIFTWADCAREWLGKYLELPKGIPSRDCIRRVLQGLQPQAFQRCFGEWLNSLVGPAGAKFLSIDGKTLRRSYGGRSHDKQHQLGALHLVSVWAKEQGLTLGQVATAEKSNEITAIPLLLDMVDVKDAIVSIDAMGTQKAIAGKIIDKGGDYVLPVKGNQGHLEADVRTLLDKALENDFKGIKVSRQHTTETHHGRTEQRWYYQINVPPALRGLKQWKGLRTLGLVVRTRETDGIETGDVQYYISSLKRNVKTFAKAVRGHWGIENTCHWSLDMAFREDESRTRDRHVAENLAWLRRFTLSLLKQHPNKKHSLVMKRRMAGWNPAFLAEILFGQTT